MSKLTIGDKFVLITLIKLRKVAIIPFSDSAKEELGVLNSIKDKLQKELNEEVDKLNKNG